MLNPARIEHLAATATTAEIPPLSAAQANAVVALLDVHHPLHSECLRKAKALMVEHSPADADNPAELERVAGDLFALASR
jgi:hypothetical protein